MAKKIAWPLAFLCAYSEICTDEQRKHTQTAKRDRARHGIQITSTLTT